MPCCLAQEVLQTALTHLGCSGCKPGLSMSSLTPAHILQVASSAWFDLQPEVNIAQAISDTGRPLLDSLPALCIAHAVLLAAKHASHNALLQACATQLSVLLSQHSRHTASIHDAPAASFTCCWLRHLATHRCYSLGRTLRAHDAACPPVHRTQPRLPAHHAGASLVLACCSAVHAQQRFTQGSSQLPCIPCALHTAGSSQSLQLPARCKDQTGCPPSCAAVQLAWTPVSCQPLVLAVRCAHSACCHTSCTRAEPSDLSSCYACAPARLAAAADECTQACVRSHT